MADKKISNGFVALGSAAVLAVYTAGYVRTKSAADRFVLQAEMRRPAIPTPPSAGASTAMARVAPAEHEGGEVVAPVRAVRKFRKAGHRTQPRATGPIAPPPAAFTPAAPPVEQPVPAAEQAGPSPVQEPPPPPKPAYKDGTYLGWGTSRHGDIQAQVIIQNGRIDSATIAQCWTRYSCSVISKLPPQVADRQSPETDYVSGATQSTNAFYYAVVEALSKAK